MNDFKIDDELWYFYENKDVMNFKKIKLLNRHSNGYHDCEIIDFSKNIMIEKIHESELFKTLESCVLNQVNFQMHKNYNILYRLFYLMDKAREKYEEKINNEF